MAEDLIDWENVRRQSLATLKIANQKTGRSPNDQGAAPLTVDDVIAGSATILFVDPATGRELARLVNVKVGS